MPTPANPPSHAFTYGAHMAVNMAIGFLFLGAGSLTFGTSKEAGKHWGRRAAASLQLAHALLHRRIQALRECTTWAVVFPLA